MKDMVVIVEAERDLASGAHPLTGSFGAQTADLAVPRGTDVALPAPSGVGTTTTARVCRRRCPPRTAKNARFRRHGVARVADDVRSAIFLTGRFAALEARPDRSASCPARFDTPPLTTGGSPWLLIDHP